MAASATASKHYDPCHDAATRLRKADEIKSRFNKLTPRERQVLDLLVAGFANKQIARTLRVSVRTVEVHRARVMRKMEARSPIDLACNIQCARCGVLENTRQ